MPGNMGNVLCLLGVVVLAPPNPNRALVCRERAPVTLLHASDLVCVFVVEKQSILVIRRPLAHPMITRLHVIRFATAAPFCRLASDGLQANKTGCH